MRMRMRTCKRCVIVVLLCSVLVGVEEKERNDHVGLQLLCKLLAGPVHHLEHHLRGKTDTFYIERDTRSWLSALE